MSAPDRLKRRDLVERRYCPTCGHQMTPDVMANLPPRPYWVCPACHEARPA